MLMRVFFLSLLFVCLVLCAGVHAAEAPAKAVEAGEPPVAAQDKKAKEETEVCYPEVLTEQERQLGMGIPCAKKNYIHVPLTDVQRNVQHDASGIWTDQEVKDSKIEGALGGVLIWGKTVKVGATEVTVSMIAAGLCGTPAVCPFRVRLRTSGKPDVLKGWPKSDQACASGKYYFIRDDFKELVACDVHFALD